MTARATTFLILLLSSSALAGNDSWTLPQYRLKLDVTEELESPYWIVSTSGVDDGDCGDTIANACKSPHYTLKNRVPDNTKAFVYLMGDTWDNTYAIGGGCNKILRVQSLLDSGAYIDPNKTNNEANRITIRNYPGKWPTFDGAGVCGSISLGRYMTAQGLTLTNGQDFCLSGQNRPANWPGVSNPSGPEYAVTGVEVKNNVFLNCGNNDGNVRLCTDQNGYVSMGTSDGAVDWEISGNVFINGGRPDNPACPTDGTDSAQWRHDHHIYGGGKNIHVFNNTFDNQRVGYPLRWLGAHEPTTGTLSADDWGLIAYNNTFGPTTNLEPIRRDNDEGIPYRYYEINNRGATDTKSYLANNLVLDPSKMRETLYATYGPDSYYDQPINDLIWDLDGGDGVGGDHPPAGSVCLGNMVQALVYGNTTDWSYCGENDSDGLYTPPTVSGNTRDITAAQFNMVDPANFDYRIRSGSIADGAADPAALFVPTEDFLGNPRNPSSFSVGAFEVDD